jgi:O-antigen biosynthesis protein
MLDQRQKSSGGAATVSVVVCAHAADRFHLLSQALTSLERQSRPPHEIIAVIDHNDELLAAVEAAHAGLRVVPNAGSSGLSGARNTGVGASSGDIVAFLDDDAVAPVDWVERLSAHYADQRVIGVGGKVVPVWPTARPAWLAEEFDWVVGCSYRGLPERTAEVRNLIGCNMSLRRIVFERIGGFAEELGREGGNAAGCEETEIYIRAKQHFPVGRIVYDPEIAVSHIIAEARTTWGYFRSRCLAEGKSKAAMARRTGTGDGLSSERDYVRRVLPRAVLRGVGDTVLRGDISGVGRAGSVVAGLAYVAGAYLLARQGRPRKIPPVAAGFAPIRILDVDVDEPLQPLEQATAESGVSYGGAFCLVREGGRPVRVVEFPLAGSTISEVELQRLLSPEGPTRPRGARSETRFEAPGARVVIATRDRPESLARCLDSLLRQDYPQFEIVVVDNAPTSSTTAEMIRSRYADTGRVVYMREDRPGLGRAHNRGIAEAQAPVIAFTDDDVIADPQWLGALASNFAGADRLGCVTGLILPAELETRAQLWTERHGGFGKGFERRVFDMREPPPGNRLFPYAAGSFGSGANMAFRTSALRKIGGFDPALGAGTTARGGDDLAAFCAVLRADFQLAYEPGAIVWHHHRRSEEGMRRQAYGYGVGLGAYLTKIMLDEPQVLLHFALAFPWAAAHILSPGSSKNNRLPPDYPAGLRWSERLGILAGIPAYLRSRAASRRSLQELTGAPEPTAGSVGH